MPTVPVYVCLAISERLSWVACDNPVAGGASFERTLIRPYLRDRLRGLCTQKLCGQVRD